MPYDRNADLPQQVTENLPQRAQTIYRKAWNSAWDQYKDPDDRQGDADREETAHRVAWAAVKEVYEKDGDGNWVRKDNDG